LENIDETSQAPLNRFEVQEEVKPSKKTQDIQISFKGLIPIDQYKNFIVETIKDKYEGSSKSTFTYAKPYSQRIDDMKMSIRYQPPKFQQFNKQYVAHFIKTCNNIGTYGDLLVK
jgi:hypothetical protein